MNRCRFARGCWIALLAANLTLLPGLARGQLRSNGLIDQENARRAGMQVRWFTMVQLDPATTRIRDMTLHVHSDLAQTYYEIEADGEFQVISAKGLDSYGEPLGDDGAKRVADERADLLRKRGFKSVQVSRRVVPQTTLYVLTDASLLQAIDAETGKTLWKATVGRPDLASVGPSVSDDYVSVINGLKLHVFNAHTGHRIWTEPIAHAAGVRPVLIDQLVFVPSVSGEVFGYDIQDRLRDVPSFRSFGRILSPATRMEKHLIWADDKGYVNIAGAYQYNVEYMLETNSRLSTSPIFHPPNTLLFATHHGTLYAYDLPKPNLRWRYPTGQRTYGEPVVVGDRVYFITDISGLNCITLVDGQRVWSAPTIVKFIAATQEHLYVVDRARHLVKLDARTGSRLAEVRVDDMDLVLVNRLTDRIFIGTRRGLIQCVHEEANRWPVIHAGGEMEAAPKKPDAKQPPAGPKQPPAQAKPKTDNPFGAPDDNPFGAPGGGAKPPAKKPDDNPFGDNPFGS